MTFDNSLHERPPSSDCVIRLHLGQKNVLCISLPSEPCRSDGHPQQLTFNMSSSIGPAAGNIAIAALAGVPPSGVRAGGVQLSSEGEAGSAGELGSSPSRPC